MATGPEHYEMAQDWLQTAWDMHNGGRPDTAAFYLQAAQAHATLALAAATAMVPDMTAGEWPGWRKVAGSEETRRDE